MPFKHYVARVERELTQLFTNKSALTEAMSYSALAGGKRFRPILSYACANAFGTDLSRVDSSACALELLHVYSLIHDDLPAMDDDDMRHNQPACHKKFGDALAVLAGDGLQAMAFEILANEKNLPAETKIKLLQSLSQAAFEMAQGQAIDLSVVGKSIDIQDLQKMHQKKTGALLACSVDLGAICSPTCSVKNREILQIFANSIGLAYQIQDDVLDVEAPLSILGKQQHSDSEKNKPTYPSLLGLQDSKKRFNVLYEQAFDALSDLQANTQELQLLTQTLKNRSF
jgi:farnesyl diphosphate synthase/geranylgeranyl diphosphate synthase type II